MSRRKRVLKSFWKSGDPFVWLTGGALGFSVIMIVALIVIVAANALGFFWPGQLVLAQLQGGGELLGQVVAHEEIPGPRSAAGQTRYRTEFQVANRDLYGADFRWVEDEQILSRAFPEDAIFFERWEWGHLFGFLKTVTQDGKVIAEGPAEAWKKFQEIHPLTQETLEHIHYIERKEIGAINYDIERLRLQIKRVWLEEHDPARAAERVKDLEQQGEVLQQQYQEKAQELRALNVENARYRIVVQAAGGRENRAKGWRP